MSHPAVDRPVTSSSNPISAATTKKRRKKTERTKTLCHRILYTPATQSISSIGVKLDQTPYQFTFAGHEISVSANLPIKLELTDRKILDFILVLLTKYLRATGPWTDGWVSFTLDDVMPKSLLDHINACGTSNRGNLCIVPFLNSLFYRVPANAYAIAKRMMAHYHFYSNGNAKNRNRLRVQTLVECCPDLNAKLPADRRRTFCNALGILTTPTATCEAIMPCDYANGPPPVAYEDWLNAVIEFNPPEIEYASRNDLDSAYELFQHTVEQRPTADVDATDQEDIITESTDGEPPHEHQGTMEPKADPSPPRLDPALERNPSTPPTVRPYVRRAASPAPSLFNK